MKLLRTRTGLLWCRNAVRMCGQRWRAGSRRGAAWETALLSEPSQLRSRVLWRTQLGRVCWTPSVSAGLTAKSVKRSLPAQPSPASRFGYVSNGRSQTRHEYGFSQPRRVAGPLGPAHLTDQSAMRTPVAERRSAACHSASLKKPRT